jgi:hypothetical protein
LKEDAMGQKLVARIQNLLRRAQDIPAGADTSDEYWEDLPYGGAGFASVSRASVTKTVAQYLGDDPVVDREWQELLGWATGGAVGVAVPAPLSARDESEQRTPALARAKAATVSAAPDEEEAEWAACLARAKAAAVAARPDMADEEQEWLATLARAKAHAEADAVALFSEEQEWLATLARAKAQPEKRPSSRRKDVREKDEESEWRTLIERAKARPTVRAELRNLSQLMDRMRAGTKMSATG